MQPGPRCVLVSGIWRRINNRGGDDSSVRKVGRVTRVPGFVYCPELDTWTV